MNQPTDAPVLDWIRTPLGAYSPVGYPWVILDFVDSSHYATLYLHNVKQTGSPAPSVERAMRWAESYLCRLHRDMQALFDDAPQVLRWSAPDDTGTAHAEVHGWTITATDRAWNATHAYGGSVTTPYVHVSTLQAQQEGAESMLQLMGVRFQRVSTVRS